jgi:putative lumazine-binding protein
MTTTTTTTTTTTATTPDYDDIVRVVQLYIDGWKGDVNKFKEAFHEEAWIFFTDAHGVLHTGLLTDRFERWVAGNRPMEGRVIAVTQAGDVASVLLGIANPADPSDSWVDMHALLRINGVWKITNKTATHSSRAAWAKA